MSNIKEKLLNIQVQLKAPKNQKNTLGNYNYRSCEDILEALKPLLEESKAFLTLSDKITQVGDRYYIESTAILTDAEKEDYISVTALAREDEAKKGMDLAQITGSASSYARKYALNGLFAIDDTKDSDATNKHGKSEDKKDKSKAAEENTEELKCSSCGAEINQAVSAFSKNKFGRELCRDCQTKEKK